MLLDLFCWLNIQQDSSAGTVSEKTVMSGSFLRTKYEKGLQETSIQLHPWIKQKYSKVFLLKKSDSFSCVLIQLSIYECCISKKFIIFKLFFQWTDANITNALLPAFAQTAAVLGDSSTHPLIHKKFYLTHLFTKTFVSIQQD